MSLKTWMKEFYPVEASAMADKSDVKCIEHSLRKWEGALKKNTERHGVGYGGSCIKSGNGSYLIFGSDSCALCEKHLMSVSGCKACPLYAANNYKSPCDSPASIYEASYDDPRPMIRLLKKALKMAKGAK